MDLAINLDPALAGSVDFGDLNMQSGDLTLTADAIGGTTHPVMQDINIRLRTYLGEYFINNRLGIPWHQLALGSRPEQSQLDAVIQNCILTTKGVLRLSSYESSIDTRTRVLTIKFHAATTRGPISYASAISPTSSQGTAAT